MPSQTLTSLKSKKLAIEKEIDVLEKVVTNKHSILDQLLLEIKTAGTILEDNFSKEELENARKHKEKMDKLEDQCEKLETYLNILRNSEEELKNSILELEKKKDDIKWSINQENQKLSEVTQKTNRLNSIISGLRTDETTYKNNINDLMSSVVNLKDELARQINKNSQETYDMQSAYNKEQSKLDDELKNTHLKLRQAKQSLQLYENKLISLEEEHKKRDNDLIQRENSLIVKTNAFEKEKLVFEQETRRWNYRKPV